MPIEVNESKVARIGSLLLSLGLLDLGLGLLLDFAVVEGQELVDGQLVLVFLQPLLHARLPVRQVLLVGRSQFQLLLLGPLLVGLAVLQTVGADRLVQLGGEFKSLSRLFALLRDFGGLSFECVLLGNGEGLQQFAGLLAASSDALSGLLDDLAFGVDLLGEEGDVADALEGLHVLLGVLGVDFFPVRLLNSVIFLQFFLDFGGLLPSLAESLGGLAEILHLLAGGLLLDVAGVGGDGPLGLCLDEVGELLDGVLGGGEAEEGVAEEEVLHLKLIEMDSMPHV